MTRRIMGLATALLLAAAVPALAETFTETFDGGSNTGGWTYYAPVETIEDAGGNPGAYLHADGLDTYAPYPRTPLGTESIFTGDYRARGVTSVGVDLITLYVDFSAAERECSVMLYSDNGTPGVTDDDWAAFKLGPFIPEPGDGWMSYDFEIPSQQTEWPDGWGSLQFGPGAPDPDWNALMANVSSLGFHHGNPEFFFIFQMWELGLDNPRITYEGGVATEATDWGTIKSLFR